MRVYVKKTTRASWSKKHLLAALDAVAQGSSNRRAAKDFGVPEGTIRAYLKRKTASNSVVVQKCGAISTFTKEQEAAMSEFIIKQSNAFYGLSLKEFLKMIFDYAEANKIPHKFYKKKSNSKPSATRSNQS